MRVPTLHVLPTPTPLAEEVPSDGLEEARGCLAAVVVSCVLWVVIIVGLTTAWTAVHPR